MIKLDDVKMKSKGTMPTCEVKKGFEDEGKSGSGASMDSSLIRANKGQVSDGGTPMPKKGSGGFEYFDQWKSAANKREIYPDEGK